MWYDRKARNYFAWDGNSVKNISEKIKVPLYNEENDSPDDPGNYGVVKWMRNDEAVFVYDRYGVWKVNPDANQLPVNIINGRDRKIRYRYVQVDPEERYIARDQQIVLTTFNEVTKKAGLWETKYKDDEYVGKVFLPIQITENPTLTR